MSPAPQLAEAVEHALRAPSGHNTQPWRWRVDNAGGAVERYADRGRHLPATDPDSQIGEEMHLAEKPVKN